MELAGALFVASLFAPVIVLLLCAASLLVPTRAARERAYENRVHTVSN